MREAVHVTWFRDRLRSLHVLHPLHHTPHRHASDLHPDLHWNLGRGFQTSRLKIWEVCTIILTSLSFIMASRVNTASFMAFYFQETFQFVYTDNRFLLHSFFKYLYFYITQCLRLPLINWQKFYYVFIHLFRIQKKMKLKDKEILRISSFIHELDFFSLPEIWINVNDGYFGTIKFWDSLSKFLWHVDFTF